MQEKSRYAVAFAEKVMSANKHFIDPQTLRVGKLNEETTWREPGDGPQPGYVIRINPKYQRRIQHIFLTGGKKRDGEGTPMGLNTQKLQYAKVWETYQEAVAFAEENQHFCGEPLQICWTPNRYSHQYEVCGTKELVKIAQNIEVVGGDQEIPEYIPISIPQQTHFTFAF